MGDITTQANAIIPDYNLMALPKQFEESNTLFAELRKNTLKMKRGTQSHLFGVQMTKSEANVTAPYASDDATMPVYRDPVIEQVTVQPVYSYMTFTMYPTAADSFQDGKSFIKNLLNFKLMNAQENTIARMGQVFLGGIAPGAHQGTGVIGLVNADPGTGTTITFDSRFGKTGIGSGMGVTPDDLFGEGMHIDFINPADGAVRSNTPSGGYRITAVDDVNHTLTIASAADATIADNDYIVRYGEYNSGINPLMQLVSNTDGPTSVLGVSRSTYPKWMSTRIHNSGTGWAISDALLGQLFTRVANRTGKQPKAGYRLVSREETCDQIAAIATGMQRLAPNEAKIGSNKPTFTYRGTEFSFLTDTHLAANRVWLLDFDDIGLLELKPLEWYKLNGTYLHPVVASATAAMLVRAVGYWRGNLYLKSRFRHGVLEDVIQA